MTTLELPRALVDMEIGRPQAAAYVIWKHAA